MKIKLYNNIGTTYHGDIEIADHLVHTGNWIRRPAFGKMTEDALYLIVAIDHTAPESDSVITQATAWEVWPHHRANSMTRLIDSFEDR